MSDSPHKRSVPAIRAVGVAALLGGAALAWFGRDAFLGGTPAPVIGGLLALVLGVPLTVFPGKIAEL